jgi:type I restriction enzyme S subunit
VPAEVEFLDSLPFGWRTLRGKYVFSEYSERSESGEEQLLSVSEYYGVKPRGEVIEEGDFLSRAESLVGYKKCQKNDLVMNIMLAWKCGLGVSKYDGIVSPAYSVFRFNGNASPDYMHYLLRTDTYTGHFKTRSNGVIDSRLRLYPESFSNVSLVLPSINEQEKIVAFLDHETAKIDALIEKQQRLIELLKEKRQAVISHAVTKGLNPNAPMKESGVEWLGEVPAHWEVKRLKNTSQIIDCRNKTPEYFENGEYFVIRTTNVKNQVLAMADALYTDERNFKIWTQRGVPPAGSILFTREAPAGEVCLVPDDIKFCLGQRMMNFICHDSEYTEFLFDFLISDCLEKYIESVSHGSTVSHLRVEQVENIPVVVPPAHEAKQIHGVLAKLKSRFSELTEKAEEAILLMQERRTALISAAVTGKIDVRDWQAAA